MKFHVRELMYFNIYCHIHVSNGAACTNPHLQNAHCFLVISSKREDHIYMYSCGRYVLFLVHTLFTPLQALKYPNSLNIS